MIQLLDARSDSLTVTWPVVPGAKRYVLELRSAEEFQELSSKLTQPQAKKKNLEANSNYWFRVAAVLEDDSQGDWVTHDDDKAFSTLSLDAICLEAPTTSIGGNEALTVAWKAGTDATAKYELQMRENKGGEAWATIAASLSGTQAKKKNLTSSLGYQFRVKVANSSDQAFSPPSTAMVAKGLSQALQRQWFSGVTSLLRNPGGKPQPLADALGGKEFVLFYVSAHWCPPCRKFTPMLANWYASHKAFVQVVFLSADHDEQGFLGYFRQSHPWTAIDYDNDARETLMGRLQVSGIPRLVVIDANTGRIVENNAVGKPLDLDTWRRAAKR